jgi:hypothetical protein
MAEPLREQVVLAVMAKLQAMTGVRFWGGTYRNPIRVERAIAMPGGNNQFPWLALEEGSLDGTGSTVKIEVTAGGEVGLRHEFKVLLVGNVTGDAVATAGTWLQRLWADCLKTLMAENTLGGLVMAIEWEPEMLTDMATIDGVAEFVQPLIITFHETFTTD